MLWFPSELDRLQRTLAMVSHCAQSGAREFFSVYCVPPCTPMPQSRSLSPPCGRVLLLVILCKIYFGREVGVPLSWSSLSSEKLYAVGLLPVAARLCPVSVGAWVGDSCPSPSGVVSCRFLGPGWFPAVLPREKSFSHPSPSHGVLSYVLGLTVGSSRLCFLEIRVWEGFSPV